MWRWSLPAARGFSCVIDLKTLLQTAAVCFVAAFAILAILSLCLIPMTYFRPDLPVDRLYMYHLCLNRVGWSWGIIVVLLGVVAAGLIVVLDLPIPPKLRGWQNAAVRIFFLFVIATSWYLSTSLSIRLNGGVWEIGGRFRAYQPIGLQEAIHYLWLNIRSSLAMIMLWSFIGCWFFWNFLKALALKRLYCAP